MTLSHPAWQLLIIGLLSSPIVASVSASAPSPFLSTTCVIPSPNIPSVAAGSSGTILFRCGRDPAFTVNRPGSATPVFALPIGYVSLSIVDHSPTSTSCSLGRMLTSGLESSFSRKGTFDYCLTFTNPPITGLASFTVGWVKQ